MQLTEDEGIRKKLNIVDNATELCYYHMSMNLLVFHVVTT